MTILRGRVLALLAMPVAIGAQADNGDLYKIQTRRLADGVYMAYRAEPLRYWVEGNATIIINDSDVVVVDAGGTPASAENTIREIRKLTDKPVRYLINTHDHVDHTLGNQVYLARYPGLEIIAHPRARDALDTDGRQYVADQIAAIDSVAIKAPALYQRLRDEKTPGVENVIEYWKRYERDDSKPRQREYRKTVITLPTLTVDGKLVLQRGSRTIEIMHLGHGDTPGDLVVYLPKEKIVCSGDMVTAPVPYGFTVEPFQWVVTLKRLLALDFDQLVPGHGSLLEGKSYVQRLVAMEELLQRQVRDAVTAGLDLDATRARIDLTAFRSHFTGGDPVAEYRFLGWYQRPATATAYQLIKEGRAPPP